MTRRLPRVIALLAAYNEERFIAGCLEHLIDHHVEPYLIDNSSTDRTLAIAESYLGRGLLGLETLPRDHVYRWKSILQRKEELANTLDADWFMNVDPDEIRLPHQPGCSLVEAFATVEALGFSAANFQEFTFIPTREEPYHDHPDFLKTMRRYYPFTSADLNQIKAWKRPRGRVEFAFSGAHQVRFEGINIFPRDFVMKHYMFLSKEHAARKYIQKTFDPEELAIGWHTLRARLRPELIALPPEAELRLFTSDGTLDATDPRHRHYLFDVDWALVQ